MNKDGVLEELCCYLGPKKNKNTKKIWWSTEYPVATGRQRKCDTISGRISCLAPNLRAKTSKILFIYSLTMISLTKLLAAQTLG